MHFSLVDVEVDDYSTLVLKQTGEFFAGKSIFSYFILYLYSFEKQCFQFFPCTYKKVFFNYFLEKIWGESHCDGDKF